MALRQRKLVRIIARHMDSALGHLLVHAGGKTHGVGAGAGKALGLVLAKSALRTLGRAASRNLQIKMAVHAKRDGALGGLEVLGHIGIEIVLAIEHRVLLDLAVGR